MFRNVNSIRLANMKPTLLFENSILSFRCSLSQISKDFGLQISTLKTKVMAFHGADPIRANVCLLYTSRCV